MNSIDNSRPASLMLVGEVASSGIACGTAVVCNCSSPTIVTRREVAAEHVECEFAKFDAAVSDAETNLLAIQEGVRRSLGAEEAKIFEMQILLTRDIRLRDAVKHLCLENRSNVEAAVDDAIKHLATMFNRLDDIFFRQRGADLHDVGRRLLDQLAQKTVSPPDELPPDAILVTEEPLASFVGQLKMGGIKGMIATRGGTTTHASILARALGIPVLVQVQEAAQKIQTGDFLIVDALAGRAFIEPNQALLQQYDRLQDEMLAHRNALSELTGLPTVTNDGLEIRLSANIGQTAEALTAANLNADGVGLYRTEFVYLSRDQFPSEDEQFKFYKATADRFRNEKTVIRILDVGSDKPLDYFPLPIERNPALGSRGTRLVLSHPAILDTQLRAILRLSATHHVSILFPMIGGIDEFRSARRAVESAKAALSRDGQAFNPGIQIGAMIETPAAAILIDRLADEADFLSVGANDLVQHILAADRAGSGVGTAYQALHPAVVRTLSKLAKIAQRKGKSLSLCGEIAAEPAHTALLIGLGFRSFSVGPEQILEIRHAVRSVRSDEARKMAAIVLRMNTTREILEFVQQEWNHSRPVAPPEVGAGQAGRKPWVRDNTDLERFECDLDGTELAFLAYTLEDDYLTLEETFVPERFRGRGVASDLVRFALSIALNNNWKIVSRCSYVDSFIENHPEFTDLL